MGSFTQVVNALNDEDASACVGCNAPRYAEHHDDDCEPGCMADGCLDYEMNPLNRWGLCENCHD